MAGLTLYLERVTDFADCPLEFWALANEEFLRDGPHVRDHLAREIPRRPTLVRFLETLERTTLIGFRGAFMLSW